MYIYHFFICTSGHLDQILDIPMNTIVNVSVCSSFQISRFFFLPCDKYLRVDLLDHTADLILISLRNSHIVFYKYWVSFYSYQQCMNFFTLMPALLVLGIGMRVRLCVCVCVRVHI